MTTAIEDMRVNHSRPDILVSKLFLHRPNVVAGRKQMRRKGMSKSVTTGGDQMGTRRIVVSDSQEFSLSRRLTAGSSEKAE
jgi:hypothetical protein